MGKIKYLLHCLGSFFQKEKCPFCGGDEFVLIQRKYLVTKLIKCKKCKLQHRHPKDTPEFLNKFYQEEYQVAGGFMTFFPDEKKLEELKQSRFISNELRDFTYFLNLIKRKEGKQVRVVDYGCSWGYVVAQFKMAGADAEGFEISKPMTDFGREKLGLRLFNNTNDIRKGNDILFSAHTIEHLPDVASFFQTVKESLTPGGFLVIICPNGTGEYRKMDPSNFSQSWGQVHPNYMDIEFFTTAFKDNPYLILTSNWQHDIDRIHEWDQQSQYVTPDKTGWELLFITRPNLPLHNVSE